MVVLVWTLLTLVLSCGHASSDSKGPAMYYSPDGRLHINTGNSKQLVIDGVPLETMIANIVDQKLMNYTAPTLPPSLASPTTAAPGSTTPSSHFESATSNPYVNSTICTGGVTRTSISVQGSATSRTRVFDGFEWSTAAANLTKVRHMHCQVALNGFHYVFGGLSGTHGSLSTVEQLDARNGSNTWIELATRLPKNTYGHSCVTYQDAIYVIGGFVDAKISTIVRKFTQLGGFQGGASLDYARAYHTASVFQNKIYVVGGLGTSTQFETAIEAYSGGTEWLTLSHTAKKYWAPSFALSDEMIVIAGRESSDELRISHVKSCLGVSATTTANRPSLEVDVAGGVAFLFSGKVYYCGGYSSNFGEIDECYRYRGSANTWADAPAMPSGFTSHAACSSVIV
eukprot:m.37729 g.37729  ORF g.37729 m.37729 type:complete len:398 (+) comp12539_c0_seq1:41-1234(+)